MSRDKQKDYSNDEVTVSWKPHLCWHSGICFNGLPQVFDPLERPWVNIYGANTDTIIDQVKKCPSRALTTKMNSEIKNDEH